jgi:ABC-type lipoprotein export system ATPase subunit
MQRTPPEAEHARTPMLCRCRPDSLSRHRRLMGFVPQNDTMHRSLTVEENLTFSACFRRVDRLCGAAELPAGHNGVGVPPLTA